MYFENDAASCAEMTAGQANGMPLLMLFCLLFMTVLTIVTGIYSNPIRLVVEKLVF